MILIISFTLQLALNINSFHVQITLQPIETSSSPIHQPQCVRTDFIIISICKRPEWKEKKGCRRSRERGKKQDLARYPPDESDSSSLLRCHFKMHHYSYVYICRPHYRAATKCGRAKTETFGNNDVVTQISLVHSRARPILDFLGRCLYYRMKGNLRCWRFRSPHMLLNGPISRGYDIMC